MERTEHSLLNASTTGPRQPEHPSAFHLFLVPSAHWCQQKQPWSTLAAWPAGGVGAVRTARVQPRRQARVESCSKGKCHISQQRCWEELLLNYSIGAWVCVSHRSLLELVRETVQEACLVCWSNWCRESWLLCSWHENFSCSTKPKDRFHQQNKYSWIFSQRISNNYGCQTQSKLKI